MSLVPARQEVASLASYRAGAQIADTIRLNANEAPATDPDRSLNRYPEIRPEAVRRRLSDLLSVPGENLLVTRGSSEAIDALTRTWCRAYRDNVIITPPTFELYRVYADIQGVGVLTVPLVGESFAVDTDALLDAADENTKLIFLCSPNNPTGGLIAESDILRIVDARKGRSLVVVDEAYIEFSGRESMTRFIDRHENLVVLRTLSKAHALAGARCGAAIATEPVIDLLEKVLPPYSFSTPATEAILNALSPAMIKNANENVLRVTEERDRMTRELELLNCVERVYPSAANFLFVRLKNASAVLRHLQDERILIRHFGNADELEDCVRITISTTDENQQLLKVLKRLDGGDT